MEGFIIFLQVVLSIVVLVVFFVMAARIRKIKQHLESGTNYYKLYWIERNLGDYDKAYRYALLYYLEDVFDAHYNYNKYMPDEKDQRRITEMCEAINKPAPDFKKLGVDK